MVNLAAHALLLRSIFRRSTLQTSGCFGWSALLRPGGAPYAVRWPRQIRPACAWVGEGGDCSGHSAARCRPWHVAPAETFRREVGLHRTGHMLFTLGARTERRSQSMIQPPDPILPENPDLPNQPTPVPQKPDEQNPHVPPPLHPYPGSPDHPSPGHTPGEKEPQAPQPIGDTSHR